MVSEITTSSNLPKLAYLGPPGSYTYQCASDGFGDSVEYAERHTIAEVFNALSPEIPFALVPQENSTFGSVIETYNLLRLPEIGQSKFVRGELTLTVRHHLLVRRGVKLEDVRRVLSHEQALGQCTGFLSDKLPTATLVNTTSTSAAAQALSNEQDVLICESAAVGSALCATMFDGLEVLCENIQDSNTNMTRFYVLATSVDAPLPSGYQSSTRRKALVRIALKPSEGPHEARLLHLLTSTLLTTFGIPAVRIDRRPSLNSVPFEDVYFIELQDPIGSCIPDTEENRSGAAAIWRNRVQAGIERVLATGGEATLLGYW